MANGTFLPSLDDLDARPPLARQITEHRIQAGIPQRVLAEWVRVHPQTIAQYEQGRMVPSERTLGRIKAVLGWK